MEKDGGYVDSDSEVYWFIKKDANEFMETKNESFIDENNENVLLNDTEKGMYAHVGSNKYLLSRGSSHSTQSFPSVINKDGESIET